MLLLFMVRRSLNQVSHNQKRKEIPKVIRSVVEDDRNIDDLVKWVESAKKKTAFR